ncbi:sensor histidine kinase [Sphingomonas koreensis]|nr:sensor histidine kinase [Sphingomonas koreensis]
MIAIDAARWSLARRQFVIIGGALSIIALLLGLGGSWFINGITERTSDRVLGAAARGITDKLGVEKGVITLDMPPGAFGMLEDNARDSVFYSISIGNRFLTGYQDFPRSPSRFPDDETPHFRYDRYRGQRVRVAAEMRYLPHLKQPAIIQIAETLDERHDLGTYMLAGLAALEAVLVFFAVTLIWPAIRWGLKPVTRVRHELSSRRMGLIDLTPLSVQHVPPELAGLVNEFNTVLAKLGDAVSQARRFTADASHQMRTPLAALRTHIDVLLHHDIQNDDVKQSLRDIDDAADRLQRLITQLLALARAEEGFGTETPPMIDIVSVARKVCQTFAPTAARHGLELQFDAPEVCLVRFQPILLEELLFNLLDNSARYHKTGNLLEVIINTSGYKSMIIRDNGQGISEASIASITDRFNRINHEKYGTGLGLSIVIAICNNMGSSISIENGPSENGLNILIKFRE